MLLVNLNIKNMLVEIKTTLINLKTKPGRI